MFEERAIEECEGILGYLFDHETLALGSELQILSDFDFINYGLIAEEFCIEGRSLKLQLDGKQTVSNFNALKIHKIFEALPSIDVIHNSPVGQMMTSSGAYEFYLNKGHEYSDVATHAAELKKQLVTDFQFICGSVGYAYPNYPRDESIQLDVIFLNR